MDKLWGIPLSLLLKLMVTWALAGTVMVLLSKAMFWAVRSILTALPAVVDAGTLEAGDEGVLVALYDVEHADNIINKKTPITSATIIKGLLNLRLFKLITPYIYFICNYAAYYSDLLSEQTFRPN
jgi:hypothetical protein